MWRKLSAEELMLLTVVLEKTLESPLDCKEIQPVHSEGDQSWVFIGRNDAKAETPILWPPHAKSWFIGKGSDGGRDWGQEEKGTTEDEMAGWHHWLYGHEFEQTLGVGDGQVTHDWATELNWTHLRLPWWLRQYRICLQCKRPVFNPWVRKTLWSRKRQPTPVLFPGKSQGQRSLAGYSSWGCTELDVTEWLSFSFSLKHLRACVDLANLSHPYMTTRKPKEISFPSNHCQTLRDFLCYG